MTREEFHEKYGEVKMKFESYYKYTFTFQSTMPDGKIISCCVGGDGDGIYRFEVAADREETINELSPYSGEVIENGKIIEGFYDY